MTEGSAGPLLDVVDVVKHYQSLRPLRIKTLTLAAGQTVALAGIDRTGAEVLVNVLTGASLPDSGTVTVFGRPTTAIATSDDWLQTLRRFALLSERTVVIEELTAEENLALAHTLTLDTASDELRTQVRRLAEEVGLSPVTLSARPDGLSPADRARVRLGRALALDADVLLAEHPTAALEDERDRDAFADVLASVVRRRRIAAIYVTADPAFAKRVAADMLTLKPSTGELTSPSGWLRWFR
jgi:putative ABC transport system ATP-binding protein